MAAQISLTREQYLASIRDLTAAAEALAAKFGMTQLTWQPKAGEGWSILECLDHIAISADVFLDAMEAVILNARPGPDAASFHTAGMPSARFTLTQEPPPRRKFPAPPKIRPHPTLNPEGILPHYRKTMDRVAALVASTSGKDLNRVRFPYPVLPLVRFTVATGFLNIAAHGRRHIWQAEQIPKEPDFPG